MKIVYLPAIEQGLIDCNNLIAARTQEIIDYIEKYNSPEPLKTAKYLIINDDIIKKALELKCNLVRKSTNFMIIEE